MIYLFLREAGGGGLFCKNMEKLVLLVIHPPLLPYYLSSIVYKYID